MKILKLIIFISVLFLIFNKILASKNKRKRGFAICILEENQDSGVSGYITFKQEEDITKIVAKIAGLSKGKHGMHIHKYGSCEGACHLAGGHFNPFKKHHGGPKDKDRHVGDMGNIYSEGEHTIAVKKIQDKQIKLFGKYSILGRACVIHAGEDDLGKGGYPDSKTNGHAGARIACGTIGWQKYFQ